MIRRFIDWCVRNWPGIIWGFALLCMLILLIACAIVAVQSIGRVQSQTESDKELISLLKSSDKTDSGSSDDIKFITQRDRKKIMETQKLILARQEMLVNDYRQETNNLINKMNGWLGFWIGILALLGVVIPLAWQIRVTREAREQESRLQKLEDDCRITQKDIQSKFDKTVKDLYLMIPNFLQKELDRYKNDIGDVREDFKDLKKKQEDFLNDTVKNFKQNVEELEFMTWVRIFNSIFDIPHASDIEVRREISHYVWNNVIKGLEKYIKIYTDSNGVNGNIGTSLSVALIMVSSNLSTIRQQSQRRVRQINHLIDIIRDIVISLNTPDSKTSDIINNLSILTSSLRLAIL